MMAVILVVVKVETRVVFCRTDSMVLSFALTLCRVGRPTRGLHTKLFGVLHIQSLPIKLRGLGADNAPQRLAGEEPLEHIETDVPACGAPGDEAAIDVVPKRQERATAELLELPAKFLAAPVVLEQPRRLGPLDGALEYLRLRRPGHRERYRALGR